MRVNWLAKEETQRKQAAAIGDYNHIAGKQHKKNRASIFSECPPSARKFVVLKKYYKSQISGTKVLEISGQWLADTYGLESLKKGSG